MENKNETKNPRRKRDLEIDIIPVLKYLLSRLWLIVLVGLVTGGIAFGATKLLINPTYRSGFSAYVNNQLSQTDKDSITSSDLSASQQLTKTFSYIIRSNTVLQASLEAAGSKLTNAQFSKMVTTEIRDETQLILVYVVSEDPQEAYDLANSIAKTTPAYVADIVEGSSMKIVDYPEYPSGRYRPSYVRYGIFGFVGGALLITLILVMLFFRDDSIQDENDLEARFMLPVLGVIPDFNQIEKGSGTYYTDRYGYENQKKSV